MSAAHKTVKPSQPSKNTKPSPSPKSPKPRKPSAPRPIKPIFDPTLTRDKAGGVASCLHTGTMTMPDGTQHTYSAIEEWGSDPRFGRCRQCGAMLARTDVAPRARLNFTVTKRKAPKPDPQAVWDALIAEATGGNGNA